MAIFNKNPISLPFFFLSFIFGILLAYILGPLTKKVYVYPHPNNVNKMIYKDNADNCYHFEIEHITCPIDKTKIKDIPIQI